MNTPASGWMNVNPDFHWIVRIYCNRPSPHHEKHGRTWLVTVARDKDRPGSLWSQILVRSAPVQRKLDAWLEENRHSDDASLPPLDLNVIEALRTPGILYMHGDTPAPNQHEVREALYSGMRTNSQEYVPARESDLAGRAKLDRTCKCGFVLRLRMEKAGPVLDRLVEAGEDRIEAAQLKRLAGRV